jgi:2-amino-4-hydroxy-6-hydroxymethyldihydropteridine diphosphokinase
MVTAYIGLGSNLGNRRKTLLQAWDRLGRIKGVKLLVLSSPYSSEPVGMESANRFLNAVGALRTSLPPEELLEEMLAVEAGLGRKRRLKNRPEDRTVDLDLLYWGNRVSVGPDLVLPHPEIANRLFVLLPLAELEPGLLHPVLHKTSQEMLQELMTKQKEADPGARVRKTSWSHENKEGSG